MRIDVAVGLPDRDRSRRPDSDTPQDRYRHYEMAGAGHATPDELYYSAQPADIVRAGR